MKTEFASEVSALQADPRALAIRALRNHLEAERDFNARWAVLHDAGEPKFAGPLGCAKMASRRREVAAELQGWIELMDYLAFMAGVLTEVEVAS